MWYLIVSIPDLCTLTYSGGIILYIRNKYVSKDNLIFTSQDDILWMKISKSVLSSNKDLYICLCYVVPDDSSRQSLNESNIFDRLLESVVFVEDKLVSNCILLICGILTLARQSIQTLYQVMNVRI